MQGATLTIGTSAQRVLGPGAGGAIVQADLANTGTIYLGSQGVTADTTPTGGIQLPAGVTLPLVIDGNDPLWAVGSAAGQVLRILQTTDPAAGLEAG